MQTPALAFDFLNLPLMAAAGLVFASVLAAVYSARLGFSFLLVFLVAGMLAGEDGPGNFAFNDFQLSFVVGNVALAVILLDGGLRTRLTTFRTGLRPSLWLATAGVVVCAAITGVAAHWLLDLPWPMALLLGAIVGSTDAAAVFSLLKTSGVRLNERVEATLEIESGMNDPMAVFLTLSLIGLALATSTDATTAPPVGHWAQAGALAQALLTQMGLGLALGWGAAQALAHLLTRLRNTVQPAAGVLGLLLLSAGLGVFAASNWLGGSGFLAVYVLGVVAGNRARKAVLPALSLMDGYAWLAQATMFLLLGLLATPSEVWRTLWPALGVSAVLMAVARPASVWLCLGPQHFSRAEMAFVSWVGLRGAAPIVLAVFPVMAQVPGAQVFFNVAFVVVLSSLLLQGATIGWAARRLNVALPPQSDETAMRQVFGDFELGANRPLLALCEFYGLPMPTDDTELTLGTWMVQALQRPPVVGDTLALGQALLSVRSLSPQGDIATAGLRLRAPDPRTEPTHTDL